MNPMTLLRQAEEALELPKELLLPLLLFVGANVLSAQVARQKLQDVLGDIQDVVDTGELSRLASAVSDGDEQAVKDWLERNSQC